MEFFTSGEMPVPWIRTFVTLVQKKIDATEPCHYKPISLCTTLYKIYAKLMVDRIKPILPYLIYLEEGAFIGDQSITDNVIII